MAYSTVEGGSFRIHYASFSSISTVSSYVAGKSSDKLNWFNTNLNIYCVEYR